MAQLECIVSLEASLSVCRVYYSVDVSATRCLPLLAIMSHIMTLSSERYLTSVMSIRLGLACVHISVLVRVLYGVVGSLLNSICIAWYVCDTKRA